MINWPSLVFNGLWVAGLVVMLATWSYADWLAHFQEVRTRQLLASPSFQGFFFLGLSLVTLGLFCLGRGWLERLLWAALTLLYAWQVYSLRRER